MNWRRVMGVVLGVLGAAGLFLWWAVPNRRLTPTGPYPVTSQTWILADFDRRDPLADPKVPRRIPVQAWYPSEGPKGPVIVFIHGVKGRRHAYRSWIEELASWGYVVVAADHSPVALWPAFPDGSWAPRSSKWRSLMKEVSRPTQFTKHPVFALAHEVVEADVRSMLDDLPDRLGVSADRVLLAGHSFGGGLAASMCSRDPRCVAVINLDGPPFGEPDIAAVEVPMLVFVSGLTRTNAALDVVWPPLDRLIEVAKGPLYVADLPTTGHLELSDFGLILRPTLLRPLFGRSQFGPGELDEKLRAVAGVSVAFADRHLKGQLDVDVVKAAQRFSDSIIKLR